MDPPLRKKHIANNKKKNNNNIYTSKYIRIYEKEKENTNKKLKDYK